MRQLVPVSENRASCMTVAVLLGCAMLLLGIMNGMTVDRVSKYRNKPQVFVLLDDKRRFIVKHNLTRALDDVLNVTDLRG